MYDNERELLLKDLSARLYYGVKIKTPYNDESVVGIIKRNGYAKGTIYFDIVTDRQTYPIECAKPYLRPLSSMTVEEYVYFMSIRGMNLRSYEIQEMISEYVSHPNRIAIVNTLGRYSHNIDWLDKNMFDYRGLIQKGLAIDCTGLNIY